MSALTLPRTVSDLIEEFEAKSVAVDDAISSFSNAYEQLQMAGTVMGCFVEPIGSRSYLSADAIRKNLLKSGWRAIYRRLEIDRVATAKDKALFERALADPPPLSIDSAKATFGDYLIRPRFHILRGLAEAFTELDPAYKSHSKVRIGVKGLPKRVILSGWGDYSYGYAREKFIDMVNALAAYQGKPAFEHVEMQAISAAHDAGEDAALNGQAVTKTDRYGKTEHFQTVDRGITVRKFANGNCHVFFDSSALLDINRALAEFYGDVLPDAEEEGVAPSASTAVSKDLQFYWTPQSVVDAVLNFAGLAHIRDYRHEAPNFRVLEPSCGDGRIMDGVRGLGHNCLGIEYHPARAAEARAKGHAVVTGNFLEAPARPEFDYVVMNPPFYGRHYVKHVNHAMKFLKPRGTLVSILPATARYDHGELNGEWRDLPVASFSEAGTNVPTTMLRKVTA